MATERKAEVTWHGDLMSGEGRIDSVTSGAIGGLDVNWRARSEDAGSDTSPEELKTSATVTFQPGEGITKIALEVSGRVPGMDADAFEQAAEQAKENCPVSKALAAVPEINLNAHLES